MTLIPLQGMSDRIRHIRKFLAQSSIDAWIIYDFKGADPTGEALLGSLMPRSRQYALIIAQDDPIVVIKPRIESHKLRDLPSNFRIFDYRTQAEFQNFIRSHIHQYSRVASNFSETPMTDVLPAGRLQLLRVAGPKIQWVSGENLMQIIHSVLSSTQLASHERAAKTCTSIMEDAFSFIAERLGKIHEKNVAHFIAQRFQEEDMTTDHSPMVAVQANTANPHYDAGEVLIKRKQLVMIDLFAKWEIFADITWMAYTGSQLPSEIDTVWNTVLKARKAATATIKPNISARLPDQRAREILITAGYEDAIFHRTGHNIDSNTHGKGANLDSFEMPETRLLLPNTVVSVEPGVYLPRKFGVRSEINVLVTPTGRRITTSPQEEILLI